MDIRLAIDSDDEILNLLKVNLPDAQIHVGDVTTLFDGEIGTLPTESESALLERVRGIDVLLGGPPCQGHSDLNNHTRRHDPKNALYLKMVRAAEVLAPKIVVIENVAPVQWDRGHVVRATMEYLAQAGYMVAGRVLDLRRVGVPQRRHRFVLLASTIPAIDPDKVLDKLATATPEHQPRTVRWAIGDLLDVDATDDYDKPSRKTEASTKRMAFLFEKGTYDLPNSERPKCHRDKEHSYVSMYGRLRWDKPAQTITTGFGSMGQGRYVHPQRRRTITPHEAARLQTFPDWYDFGKETKRVALAKAIGNAVPPLLMVRLGSSIIPELCAATSTNRSESLPTRTPAASSPEALRRMQSTRRRDTAAEVSIRHLLHGHGFRYRIDREILPGSRRRADIVFVSPKVAVFVDGCFWHACPIHGTSPKANADWWAKKLEANRRRDAETTRRLRGAGWHVLRVWEHEEPADAADRISSLVRGRLREKKPELAPARKPRRRSPSPRADAFAARSPRLA
jgi:DNA (cytosine-5)-methyltransferase 1